MGGEIQTFAFCVDRNSQTHQLVDDEEGDHRDHTRPDDGGDDTDGTEGFFDPEVEGWEDIEIDIPL